MARYVRDSFLSSPSEDLREYRDTVTDVHHAADLGDRPITGRSDTDTKV